MTFIPGKSGNPIGRPKGSVGGRMMALNALDKMLAKKQNKAHLQRELEKKLTADPVGFFRTIVMPLLPREAQVSLENRGVIEWRPLLGPTNAPPPEAPPSGQAPTERLAHE